MSRFFVEDFLWLPPNDESGHSPEMNGGVFPLSFENPFEVAESLNTVRPPEYRKISLGTVTRFSKAIPWLEVAKLTDRFAHACLEVDFDIRSELLEDPAAFWKTVYKTLKRYYQCEYEEQPVSLGTKTVRQRVLHVQLGSQEWIEVKLGFSSQGELSAAQTFIENLCAQLGVGYEAVSSQNQRERSDECQRVSLTLGEKSLAGSKIHFDTKSILAFEEFVNRFLSILHDQLGVGQPTGKLVASLQSPEQAARAAFGKFKREDQSTEDPSIDPEFPLLTVPESLLLSDVVGQENAVKKIQELISIFTHQDIAREIGVELPRGMILSGPPGTGKTLLAKAFVAELRRENTKVVVLQLSASDILSKWVGESEKNVKKLEAYLLELSQSHHVVLIVDEMDALFSSRTDSDAASRGVKGTINSFLQLLQGTGPELEKVIFIGTTNLPDAIDAAAARAGRFGELIHLEMPDADIRAEFFKKCIQGGQSPEIFDTNIDFDRLAGHQFSQAEIQGVVSRARRRYLSQVVSSPEGEAAQRITQEELEGIIMERKNELAIQSGIQQLEQRRIGFALP